MNYIDSKKLLSDFIKNNGAFGGKVEAKASVHQGINDKQSILIEKITFVPKEYALRRSVDIDNEYMVAAEQDRMQLAKDNIAAELLDLISNNLEHVSVEERDNTLIYTYSVSILLEKEKADLLKQIKTLEEEKWDLSGQNRLLEMECNAYEEESLFEMLKRWFKAKTTKNTKDENAN